MMITKRVLPALFFTLVSTTAFAAVNGPVKSVTLSSGGLAEIIRSAEVGIDSEITIEVPLDQIDDVLKSLVVRDGMGQVKNLSLAGPNPLEETFRTLPFKASDLSSMPKLLDAIKGTRVKAGDKEGIVLGVTAIEGEKTPKAWQLSLMTDDGEIAMAAMPGTKVEILDAIVKAKLKTAMDVIARGNTDGARTVTLKLDGSAARNVDISYVVPAPIWKTSYRLVTSKEGEVRLQAWAVFENASGEDWTNVGVTLSSGKPVTLKQALHQHFMRDRTEVPIDTASAILPQAMAKPIMERANRVEAAPMAGSMDFEASAPAPFAMALGQQSNAAEQDVTSTFALKGTYNIKNGDTVSVPIIDQGVKAEMVSLYRAGMASNHPVAAALIENNAGISLPPGIMTVYDDKVGYVGDAQINGLPRDGKQSVSFAVDQKVNVASSVKTDQRIVSLKVVDGMIHTKSSTVETATYDITGAQDGERTVVIEIPRRSGWTFKAEGQDEATVGDYRIKAKLKAGELKSAETRFELVNDETISLIDADAFTLVAWQDAAADAETKAKLAELANARRSQNDAQVKLQVLDQDYSRAAEEQARVRENLQAVGEGDTKNRFDKQLNVLEDKLGSIEGQRIEQRKVLDDFTEKVGNIIRTF
ncbi:DUF4139 domain-containing protein (plasmid) [Agrobacterium rosae]|uniref:DUF4139 domain-containing protein n=1 Tax=Agrobacterium rosae TaxID=1972867 RepID=A0AAW9FQT8_9HYPH|nr:MULTISPECIES: DUF4139 domain-containing protein [Agrobacterium]MDX8321749.1 DUF4139 domain-containing protein [Agrobacterium sp. rho-8.1]MDX8305215.1 DUF4139 domain-containing protein [Agrobacterium rosae]MDX8311496.1 DUF4139 domain-containing protein [Agrobacterium sp. rho-13.3]MDX8316270.1 DUF4139 domain-containing protein [Agrobacterium rosae]MDX8332423.1 DUF4139 domain-containing protein [Agrobacterium rosae]